MEREERYKVRSKGRNEVREKETGTKHENREINERKDGIRKEKKEG
jgi:hypothetical protein